MRRTAVRVDDELKGHIVAGHVEGKYFVREVNPDEDLLVTRRAYALHDKVLDELVDRGVEIVVLQEPSRRLVSNIEDWQELGVPYAGPHGPQTTLSVSYMGLG